MSRALAGRPCRGERSRGRIWSGTPGSDRSERIISPRLALLVPEFDIFQYFLNNLFMFAVLMFGGGIIIGVLSSWIAIRRYLQV